jgi:hypothetical protein
MNYFKKRRALKEAKQCVTILFQNAINEIEDNGIKLVFDHYSLRSIAHSNCLTLACPSDYHDEKIRDFFRIFEKAYGEDFLYKLKHFYYTNLLEPYMKSMQPKPEDYVDEYEKLKNEILTNEK